MWDKIGAETGAKFAKDSFYGKPTTPFDADNG